MYVYNIYHSTLHHVINYVKNLYLQHKSTHLFIQKLAGLGIKLHRYITYINPFRARNHSCFHFVTIIYTQALFILYSKHIPVCLQFLLLIHYYLIVQCYALLFVTFEMKPSQFLRIKCELEVVFK